MDEVEFSENPVAVESGVPEFSEKPAAVKFSTTAGCSPTKCKAPFG
jgi:hypothetical protein